MSGTWRYRVLTSCSAASGWLASVQVRSTELPGRLHSALFATNTSSHQPQALSQLANQQHSSNGDADEPRVHTAVPGDLPRRPSGDTRAPRAHGRPRRGDPLDNRSYSPAQPAPVCGLCCDRISTAHRVPHAFRVLATGNVSPSPTTLLYDTTCKFCWAVGSGCSIGTVGLRCQISDRNLMCQEDTQRTLRRVTRCHCTSSTCS